MNAPDPTPERQFRQHADPAAVALQKLHKKLRRWVNRGEATAAERDEVAAAVATVRGLYRTRGLACPDPDGGTSRRRRAGDGPRPRTGGAT